MPAIIVDGTDDFINEAMQELKNKKFTNIGRQVAQTSSQTNLNNIAKGLKELESYKKNSGKNRVYTCNSVHTI